MFCSFFLFFLFSVYFLFFFRPPKLWDNRSRERLNGFSWNFHQTIGGECSLKRRAAAWRKSWRRLANVDALRNLRWLFRNHQRAPPAVALYNNERANWCNLVQWDSRSLLFADTGGFRLLQHVRPDWGLTSQIMANSRATYSGLWGSFYGVLSASAFTTYRPIVKRCRALYEKLFWRDFWSPKMLKSPGFYFFTPRSDEKDKNIVSGHITRGEEIKKSTSLRLM